VNAKQNSTAKYDTHGHVKNNVKFTLKNNFDIPGFFRPNLPGTGIGQIIQGQGEFGK